MPSKIHLPRVVAAVLLCGALLGTAATSVSAQTAPAAPSVSQAGSVTSIAVSGQLSTHDSDPVGYYLWHDDQGYHLRTHGPGAEHMFVARLTTTGTFKDVDNTMLETGDRSTLSKDGHVLVLRFHTYDGWDGVNFRVDGGEHLTLNLKLDGQEISTDNIFLGPRGSHPPTDPFRIEI